MTKKLPITGLPKCLDHGLYFDPAKHRLDQRTRVARTLRDISKSLLALFAHLIPAGAQLIARRAAFKALRLTTFEHNFLGGNETPVDNTEKMYMTLAGSLRADIVVLHQLAKEGSPIEKVPSLAEYLEALRSGKLVIGEPGEGEG